jgi:hypothetical protein
MWFDGMENEHVVLYACTPALPAIALATALACAHVAAVSNLWRPRSMMLDTDSGAGRE